MFTPQDRDICLRLFEKYYSERKFHDALYREAINKHASQCKLILDAGCGRYMKFCKEVAAQRMMIGIDLVSEFNTDNHASPFAVRGDVGALPFPSNVFDMVISRSVVEHLDNPQRVFREFHRVVRPGGKVVILTPNKYDYVSIAAAVTPYWLHRRFVGKIFQIPEDDVFPTRYRANTVRAIRAALTAAGFVEQELNTINHYPAYLMFSPIFFRLGVLYERITSLEVFKLLRGSILCVFQKQGRGREIDALAV